MSDNKGFMDNMSASSKVGFIIGLMVIFALGIYAYLALVVKEKAPLFTDLSQADAASIVEGLKSIKAEYTLAENGSSILVNQDEVADIRLGLMSSGVMLNNSVGLELFDNADYGMTEFAQKVNFQRALQGEIARTVMALNEVKYARVHLTLPKTSIFADQQVAAKAAITVIQNDGMQLSKQQVVGIQRLVASSVEGLPEANVVVTDERGVDISVKTQDSGELANGFVGNALIERKREFETHLTQKAERILNKALGFNSFAVSVDVNFDFTKSTSVSEKLLKPENSDKGYVRSEKNQTKFDDQTNSKGVTYKSKDSEEKSVEYLYGKSVTQTESLAGDIRNINIAVIVSQTLTEAQLTSLKQVVKAAVGLNTARGDLLEVHQITTTAESQEKIITAEDVLSMEKSKSPTSIDEKLQPLPTLKSEVSPFESYIPHILIFAACLIVLMVLIGVWLLIQKRQSRQQLLSEIQNALKTGEANGGAA